MTNTIITMKNTKTDGKRYIGILCIGIIAVVSIWICYLFAWQVLAMDCIRPYLPGIMLDAHGQLDLNAFGDYFGALNALFAGLAFAGLVVTIRQQSADLRATKSEMKAQTHQFSKQTSQLLKQDFYNRIELIYKLEERITCFGYKELAKYHLPLPIYDEDAHLDQQKLQLFTSASFHLLNMFSLSAPMPADSEELKETADTLRANAPYTWIWIKSIYNLLEDIEKDFDNEEDKNRLTRIVLNSVRSTSLLLILLCRYKGMNIPTSVVRRLTDFIDKENYIVREEKNEPVTAQDIQNEGYSVDHECVFARHDPKVRSLFLSIILDGMDLKVAAQKWEACLQEREKQYGKRAYII